MPRRSCPYDGAVERPVPPRVTESVPTVLERSMLSVDVATHCGTPVADVVKMEEFVVESVFRAVEPEPYRSAFDATVERPVPPYVVRRGLPRTRDVVLAVPLTSSLYRGLVVPMPTLPFVPM